MILFTVLSSRIVDLNYCCNPPEIIAIDTSNLKETTGPQVSLSIPLELLRVFDDGEGLTRIISALYRNVSGVLSHGLNNG